jgi:serine phosphatase RsbU (regulator of sigma subunit)
MLDYPRAYEAISQAINGSPQELVEHLIKESEIWADNRPQEDDMTFVVIEIK